ncbi:MAG TPA: GNAT family N-acetyltransferase [Thermoplasmata archaeon]|nr:GNAT family N-acetyltransferase [Thermoplasmata archaeon]
MGGDGGAPGAPYHRSSLDPVGRNDRALHLLWEEFVATIRSPTLGADTPTQLFSWLEGERESERFPTLLWRRGPENVPSGFAVMSTLPDGAAEVMHLYLAEPARSASGLGELVDALTRRSLPQPIVDIGDWIVGLTESDQREALEPRGFRHIRRERLVRPVEVPVRPTSTPDSEVRLRSLDREDRDSVLDVDRKAYENHIDRFSGPFGEREREFAPYVDKVFSGETAGLRLDASSLATAQGRPVGFSFIFDTDRGPLLGDVSVDPGWRRRGIATAMITRALETLRSTGATGEMSLFYTVANPTRAGSVYRRLGFHPPSGAPRFVPGLWIREEYRQRRGFAVADDEPRDP